MFMRMINHGRDDDDLYNKAVDFQLMNAAVGSTGVVDSCDDTVHHVADNEV